MWEERTATHFTKWMPEAMVVIFRMHGFLDWRCIIRPDEGEFYIDLKTPDLANAQRKALGFYEILTEEG